MIGLRRSRRRDNRPLVGLPSPIDAIFGFLTAFCYWLNDGIQRHSDIQVTGSIVLTADPFWQCYRPTGLRPVRLFSGPRVDILLVLGVSLS